MMKKYIISNLFLLFGVWVSAQCVAPTNLSATAITETTALLGWTENSTPAATTWELEIVDAGATPTGVATVSTNANPYTATALASGQSFDFYVRSDCGGGAFSTWVGPFTFTTLPCDFSTIAIVQTNNCLEYCFTPNGPQFGTYFDFNSGTLPTGWSASPYTVGQPCTTPMVDNTSYFWAGVTNGAGVRVVTTNVVDVSLGGTIQFYMRYGADDPDPGCEDPDLVDEGVFLQYSIDNGATWVNINTWNPTGVLTDPLYQWMQYTETIPAAAQTATSIFRWYQPQNSGPDFDNWGLDNVQISANTSGNFLWNFGDGTTSTLQNPCHTFSTPGDYTISLSVDAPNCIASSSEVLTVADTVLPIANCQDFTVTLDASGNATITAADIDNGSTDNCGIDTMTVSPNTFTAADGGQNPVTLTVTDIYGNVSTCTAIVNVPYNCGSVFTDTGGATANYSNSENITWVFTPNNAGEFVQLNFSEFNTEYRWDGMMIYNGPDTTFPIIDSGSTGNFNGMPDGAWTGDQTNPAQFAATVITSSDVSGALTVVFTSDGSVSRPGWQASIDCVTCPGPSNIAISNITANSAEISWVDNAASEWEIEIVPVGTAPTGTGVVTTSNPYTATGLNSATEYEVIIRSICSPTDSSAWIGQNFFTTSYGCGSTFVDDGGATGNYSTSQDVTYNFSSGALGATVELVFTAFDVENNWDGMAIYDGPDTTYPLIDSGSTGLFGGQPDGSFTGNGGFSPVGTTIISTNAFGALTVVFHSDGSITRAGWEATVVCNNPCADPSNLTASNPTGFTVDLDWTENGGATQWEVEAVPTGTAPTGNGVVTSTIPYTVTGLLPDTTYDFYVTAICNPGVSESYQVGPVTESTICDASVFAGININATQTIDTSVTPNEIILCNGDSVDLSLVGGFIPSSETYQWQLNGSDITGETNNILSGITTAGNYSVLVTIGNCNQTFDVTIVEDTVDASFIIDVDDGLCTITTTILGDTGGVFAFNPIPTDGATIDPVTGQISNTSVNGTYTVQYTVTSASGCVQTTTITRTTPNDCIIPSAISPNGDGLNDTFNIAFLRAKKLTIFNRFGTKVYVKNQYMNEWGGNSDAGDELPVGTYYYVIDVPEDSPITGWVYINREK